MKLRLRSLETKETLKIEVPTPFSLTQLKQLLFQALPSPSSSSSSIHLSLNRKDELYASNSPQNHSLQSLGITSGDLIFFTLNPTAFSSHQTHHEPKSTNPESNNTQNDKTPDLDTQSEKTLDFDDTQKENTLDLNTHREKTVDFDDTQKEKTLELNTDREKTLDLDNKSGKNLEYMEVDDDDDDDEDGSVAEVIGKSFSVPGFLRKLFTEELNDDDNVCDHKLLAIAVHAVLLESGFVGFDPVSNQEVPGFQFPNQWPSLVFKMSLRYTLPGIIAQMNGNVNGIETVVLKFQSLGSFCNVYGSLVNGSGMYSVSLDETRLVPFLNVVWANCGSSDEIRGPNGCLSSSISPEKEIFMFWRTVKDRLALPLLIDLCDKAGLQLPPCFMRLPRELQLKILELLNGFEVAKVACVCSELRYLVSSDDLWKQKFEEQFGDVARLEEGGGHWKEKFAQCWESRKRRRTMRGRTYIPGLYRRDPNRFIGPRFPQIIGGSHDMFVDPFPTRRRAHAYFLSRNHMPHCNLGGLDE